MAQIGRRSAIPAKAGSFNEEFDIVVVGAGENCDPCGFGEIQNSPDSSRTSIADTVALLATGSNGRLILPCAEGRM